MTDETKLHQAVNRAARAKAIIDDEILIEAFDVTTRAYLDHWMNTSLTDTATREQLWHAVKNLGKVKGHLSKAVTDGKIAQSELNDLHTKRHRAA